MQDLESFFEKYIDSDEAEKVFNSFFSAVRKAYIAGYKAALDKKQTGARILHLVCSDGKDSVKPGI
jgi:hypothetical protein